MLTDLKEEVCEQNHELPRNGLVVGSGGNVSGRDPDTGLVVIKPSGVKFSRLAPDTMVVVDLDGNVIEGKMKPSVDTGIHLYLQAPPGCGRRLSYTFAIRLELCRAGRADPGRSHADHPYPWPRRAVFALCDAGRGGHGRGHPGGGRWRDGRAGEGARGLHDGKLGDRGDLGRDVHRGSGNDDASRNAPWTGRGAWPGRNRPMPCLVPAELWSARAQEGRCLIA